MKSLLLRQWTGNRYDEFACRDALDYAEELILGYCHLSRLPDGLYRTSLQIAARLLEQREQAAGAGGAARVTVGDTSVQFGGAAGASELLAEHLSVLNRFRRVEF